MALSQNAAMASLPWWPLPSGSKNEGPMGSWTIASSANTDSQASLSRAATAARDRLPARCAGCSGLVIPMSVLPAGMDVGVGEPLERILLLLEWGVEAQAFEHPRD